MGNVGNVGFFEKYNCVSFFKKFKHKCFIFSDVRRMADEYEENILKVSDECNKDIKDIEVKYKKDIEALNAKIEELQNNNKDMVDLHNRINVSKEKIIDKLNQEISNLKSELKDKDKNHENIIKNINIDNCSKLNRIKKECADALLKADSKKNKVKEPILETPENKVNVTPDLQTLEDEIVKVQSKNNGCQLSISQIEEVKKRKAQGEKTINLAKEFGVHKSTINRALKK
jgi:DNA repair exonuclease SbcCD ATPase subunit